MGMSKRLADELQNKVYEPFYVTEDGLNRLKEKLARLKKALPELAEEAKRTAAYGDRSENDEYKNAKSALRRTKGQILNIEDQIKRAAIIESGSGASGTIRIGSTVVLEMKGSDGSTGSPRAGARKTFQILGSHETDPTRGRISYVSPLGAALMGRVKGDVVNIKTGTGSKTYRVLEVR